MNMVCFHSFMSSLISSTNVLQFLVYKPFTSLDEFILKYFAAFDAIVNVTIYIISLSLSLFFWGGGQGGCGAPPCGMLDFSSLMRGQICAPCS